ncbi:MAG: hypothetical protein FH760_24935 [Geosporobacter ferrireducens]|nr:hypothetical protein [Geosporobacter ferrireducens]
MITGFLTPRLFSKGVVNSIIAFSISTSLSLMLYSSLYNWYAANMVNSITIPAIILFFFIRQFLPFDYLQILQYKPFT